MNIPRLVVSFSHYILNDELFLEFNLFSVEYTIDSRLRALWLFESHYQVTSCQPIIGEWGESEWKGLIVVIQ